MHVFWKSLGEMHACHFGVTLHAWCYDGCMYLHVAIRTLRSSYSYHYNDLDMQLDMNYKHMQYKFAIHASNSAVYSYI